MADTKNAPLKADGTPDLDAFFSNRAKSSAANPASSAASSPPSIVKPPLTAEGVPDIEKFLESRKNVSYASTNAPQPHPYSTAQDFAEIFGNELLFGMGDEMAGASAAATSGDYKTARDAARKRYQEAEKHSPKAAIAAKMLGVGLPLVATGGMAAVPRFGMYAAQGALRGLGESEDTDVWGDIANTAGGGVKGVVSGGIGEGVGALARPVIKSMSKTPFTKAEIKAQREAALRKYYEQAKDIPPYESDLAAVKAALRPYRDAREVERVAGAATADNVNRGLAKATTTGSAAALGSMFPGVGAGLGAATGGAGALALGGRIEDQILPYITQATKGLFKDAGKVSVNSPAVTAAKRYVREEMPRVLGPAGAVLTAPMGDSQTKRIGKPIEGAGRFLVDTFSPTEKPKESLDLSNFGDGDAFGLTAEEQAKVDAEIQTDEAKRVRQKEERK